MRWQGNRESSNVEDRRGDGGTGTGPRMGPRIGGLPLGGGKFGLGAVVIAVVASMLLGVNPMTLLGLLAGGEGGLPAAPGGQAEMHVPAPDDPARLPGQLPRGADAGTTAAPQAGAAPATDEGARFVSATLALTEDVWRAQFSASGSRYRDPRLVLFRGTTPTACGRGESAMGPFYCPADEKVYIDLDFYDTLRERLGAPGDFAQAYVIAHEVGHHVQNLLGTSAKLDAARGRVPQAEYNALSVRLELQADCYAGVWAHHAEQQHRILEDGDVDEALNAASQIGDDALQQRSRGVVVPESFTHGSSAQRARWFRRGLESGNPQVCDTFGARQL